MVNCLIGPRIDETVACVIVEPVAANMGLVAPGRRVPRGAAGRVRPGRRAARSSTRSSPASALGRGGAQERYGVTPDLTCFGKVIGGGLNVGAFGGRAEIMDRLAPLGPVYQAGTLSGNPLATAAGLAALSLLDDDALRHAAATGGVVRPPACRTRSAGAGLAAAVPGRRLRWSGCTSVTTAGRLRRRPRTDERAYAAFFHAMLDRGVALAPGPYEIMFPGLAHDDDVSTQIVDTAAEAAAEVADRCEPGKSGPSARLQSALGVC